MQLLPGKPHIEVVLDAHICWWKLILPQTRHNEISRITDIVLSLAEVDINPNIRFHPLTTGERLTLLDEATNVD